MRSVQVAWLDQNSIPLTYEERRVIDDTRFSVVRPLVRDWNLQLQDVQLARGTSRTFRSFREPRLATGTSRSLGGPRRTCSWLEGPSARSRDLHLTRGTSSCRTFSWRTPASTAVPSTPNRSASKSSRYKSPVYNAYLLTYLFYKQFQ